jgi:hypothetical protein
MKRRIGVGLVLALLLSVTLFSIASAHAELVSSDLAAGAKLTAAPAKVTLVFSEEISAKRVKKEATNSKKSARCISPHCSPGDQIYSMIESRNRLLRLLRYVCVHGRSPRSPHSSSPPPR